MKRLWTVVLALGMALATHTAIHMFDIAKTAFEQEGKGYDLLETYIHLFDRQGEVFSLILGSNPGQSYRVMVLTDGEVLNNADVQVSDKAGRVLFSESQPDTFKLVQDLTASDSELHIQVTAAKMPERQGYAAVMLLRKSLP